MRHSAGGVLLGDFDKLLLRFFIAEGMQQSHATLEGLLRSRLTEDREKNLAELLSPIVMMGHFIIESWRWNGTKDAQPN